MISALAEEKAVVEVCMPRNWCRRRLLVVGLVFRVLDAVASVAAGGDHLGGKRAGR